MLRTAKAKWAIGLAAVPWVYFFGVAVSLATGPNVGGLNIPMSWLPWALLIAVAGWLITSLLLWIVLWVLDAIRRAIAPTQAAPVPEPDAVPAPSPDNGVAWPRD